MKRLKFYERPNVPLRVGAWLYGKTAYLAPGFLVGSVSDSWIPLAATYGVMGLLLIREDARAFMRKVNRPFDEAWRRHEASRFVSDRLRRVFLNAGLVHKEMVERPDQDGKVRKVEVIHYPKVKALMDEHNYYLEFEMIPGQTGKQWEGKLDAFAHALGCIMVGTEIGRGRVRVTLQHTEMMNDQVPYKEDDEHYVTVGYAPGRMLKWHFDESPHMLVVGVTGSGKSTFVRNVLAQIGEDWTLRIVDGKAVEFSFLRNMGYDVATQKDDLLRYVEEAEHEMERRYRLMAERGVNEYTELEGLQPYILLVDEFISLVESMRTKPRRGKDGEKGEDKSEKDQLFERLSKIATKGRAAGVQLILILQRPDSAFMPTLVRDNMACKVVLKGSEVAFDMAFGSEYKKLSPLPKGQGYCMIGDVPVNFSFPDYRLEAFKEDMQRKGTPRPVEREPEEASNVVRLDRAGAV